MEADVQQAKLDIGEKFICPKCNGMLGQVISEGVIEVKAQKLSEVIHVQHGQITCQWLNKDTQKRCGQRYNVRQIILPDDTKTIIIELME